MKTVIKTKKSPSNVIEISDLKELDLINGVVIFKTVDDQYGLLIQKNFREGDFRWVCLTEDVTIGNEWVGSETAVESVKRAIQLKRKVFIFESWMEAVTYMANKKQ